MEGDSYKRESSSFLSDFYPRPHMEGDGAERYDPQCQDVNFYPRPHMEGDPPHAKAGQCAENFYPRPHMEGDVVNGAVSMPGIISTHALTWRATLGVRRP